MAERIIDPRDIRRRWLEPVQVSPGGVITGINNSILFSYASRNGAAVAIATAGEVIVSEASLPFKAFPRVLRNCDEIVVKTDKMTASSTHRRLYVAQYCITLLERTDLGINLEVASPHRMISYQYPDQDLEILFWHIQNQNRALGRR